MNTHRANSRWHRWEARWERQGEWILWLLAGLLWLGWLGARALLNPDEGRYAEIAREMLVRDDWLTPRLNGFLYFEKPPLVYWATALAIKLFGLNEFAVRLWPALCGLGCVGLVRHTAEQQWGRESGQITALVAGSMLWIYANAHFLNLDMSLCFFLTLALCSLLLAEGAAAQSGTRARWQAPLWRHLVWIGLAGAVLSKGPIGLLIPAGVLVGYSFCLLLGWAWRTRSGGWRTSAPEGGLAGSLTRGLAQSLTLWRRRAWLSGGLLFVLLTAPWFIWMSLHHPDFAHFFFIHEHWDRFLTTEHRRGGPLWYFVPILLAGALPWTVYFHRLFMPWGCRRHAAAQEEAAAHTPGGNTRGKSVPGQGLLWVWCGYIFCFFSMSGSKLPSYILPMFPALALLLGPALSRTPPRWLRWPLLPLGGLWLTALGVSFFPGLMVAGHLPLAMAKGFMDGLRIAALLALASCLLAAWVWRTGRLRMGVALLALGSIAAFNAIMLGHDRQALENTSRIFAEQLRPFVRDDLPVYVVGDYDQTLPFYLGRTVTLVDYRDEFAFGEAAEPERWIPTLEAFAAHWKQTPAAPAIMPRRLYPQLQQRGVPMQVLYEDLWRVVARFGEKEPAEARDSTIPRPPGEGEGRAQNPGQTGVTDTVRGRR